MIDTNVASLAMIPGSPEALWLKNLALEDTAVTCPIIVGEVLFGVERLAAGRRRDELWQAAWNFFDLVPCLPIDVDAGHHYSRVKLARKLAGRPILDNDCWIAATCLALGAALVTRDTDFRAITQLEVVTPS